jgi:nucleoside-diphosphate-sugar epimerase
LSELYLITGGAGFIGSHLVEWLVSNDHRVRVIDNLSTGNRRNIESFLEEIEFIECDIRNLDLVTEAMEGVDYVLHQAAVPSVPRSVKDPLTSNSANVEGTLNVLLAARDANVKRVVYASSSSVYGDTPVLPKHEDMKQAPRSPYAVSKLAGELYCQAFYHTYGLETVALRYFNVFGPRQDPKSQYAAVVPKFISALLQNNPPTVFGHGEQSRDFTYVQNVVEANLLAAKAPNVAGEVVNIACGERLTINELARMLAEIIGVNTDPEHTPPRAGDVLHSLADISKATKLLGYRGEIHIHDGLKQTVEWYRELLKSKL